MINIELSDLANLQNETSSVNQINQNSEVIEGGFTTALNTTGDRMLGTLDMNSNQIINLPSPGTGNSPMRLQDFTSIQGGGTVIFPTILGGTNITVPSSTNATFTVSTVTGPNFTNVTATSAYVGPAGGIGGGVLIVHTSANENLSVQSNINATSGIALTSIKDDNATLAALELNASQVYLSATTPMVAQGGITNSGSTSFFTLTAGSPIYGAYGTNAAIAFRRAEGSSSAPSSVTAGSPIGNFGWQGYVTSSAGYTPSKARFQGLSLETSVWTATSQGCGFEFDTTASGSITRNQAMRIMAGVYVGSSTTDPGSGNLTVSGNITATGTVQAVSFTGAVPVASLNSGSNANSTTFFRGDNTWNVPAASAYTSITTLTAVTSATLGISSVFTTAYSSYEIVFENLIPATNTTTLELQYYTGTGYSATSYGGGAIFYNAGNSAAATSPTAFLQMSQSLVCTTVTPGVSGKFRIFSPAATTNIKSVVGEFIHNASSNTYSNGTMGGFWSGATTPVTGFQFLFNSGNITSGTIYIYGIT